MTGFASTGDLADKTVSFDEIGPGLYAFTAEGDPNTGVIVGDDAVAIVDAQATPAMARQVIERIRTVTDKPVRYVILSHYHAVRVLGASAYEGAEILCSHATRDLIVERGQQDWDSEYARFPRLFRAAETIPGLTWPTLAFRKEISIFLGQREIRLQHLGRGHTAGDIIAHVPDANVMFSGDLVEYHSACYCGDAQLADWPGTLDRIRAFGPAALMPGRGAALVGKAAVAEALANTGDFVRILLETARKSVAAGKDLKATHAAIRAAMDPRFGQYAIYEHCLPFNVARAYDEARGIEHPVIWTAERDQAMWAALKD